MTTIKIKCRWKRNGNENGTDLVFGIDMTGKEVTFDLAKFFNMETKETNNHIGMIVGRLNRLLGDNNDQDQFQKR